MKEVTMEITEEGLDEELAAINEQYGWYRAAAPSEKRAQLGRRLIELMRALESHWLAYSQARGGADFTSIFLIADPVDFQYQRLSGIITTCKMAIQRRAARGKAKAGG
jgi:hypothetical protein